MMCQIFMTAICGMRQILHWGILLQNYNYGAHLVVDGIFGALTQITVISFQKMRGLKADGIVGPKTWAKLKREY
ncbi:MAG: peptidoglycan-binding protein [Lachnospiraceae bacterium]|nr:peptidoglycan-binding protein [Lachnospiraceae bacterium]